MNIASKWMQTVKDVLFFSFMYKENIQLLKKINFFNKLRRKEFITLCKTVEVKTYHPGDLIIHEGEIGDFLYIIKQGTAQVFTQDTQNKIIILAELKEGSYFGEQALLNKVPVKRNASVIALTSLAVIKISHQDLQKALNAQENIRTILRLIGKREFSQKMRQQVSLLHFLPEDLLYKLKGKILNFPDQHIVFSQGEKSDYVYFILSGSVVIHLSKSDGFSSTTILNPGQIFGELGVLEQTVRVGTASAQGPIKVLAIKGRIFRDIYQSTPELQNVLQTRQYFYHLAQRGIVSIYHSNILDIPSISIEYKLDDNRKIFAAQAFDKTLFTMQDKTAVHVDTIFFQQGELLRREIGICNKKIVSIFVLGQWIELGSLCGLLLDAIPIEDWQIELFKKTGSLATEKLQYKNNHEQICYCMHVTRSDIERNIREGITQLKPLLEKTGAAQVCGGCRPRINEMLGVMTWSFVAVINMPLNASVRVYRLYPRDKILYSYQPGQYIVVSAFIGTHWVQRSYTLTSLSDENNYYEIAIKYEPDGYFSPWLFKQMVENPIIKISPPQGDFIFNTRKKTPVVFFAAGIGITPAYAFACAIEKQRSSRPLFIHYSAHTKDDLVFIEKFKQIALHYMHFQFETRVTSEQGRLQENDIIEILHRTKKAHFYICGPEAYREFIIATLKKHKIKDDRIKVEIFTTKPLEFAKKNTL